MKQKLFSAQFIFSLVLVLGVSVIPAIAQWSEPPSGTVAPANNRPAPVHVGPETQSKSGNLIVNAGGTFASGLLVPRGDVTVGNAINDAAIGVNAKVKAFGNVWADKYCDRLGGNCYTSTEMGGGGTQSQSAISWVKMYQLNAEPTIAIAPGTVNLIITPAGYVECQLPADKGSGAELEFKADGVTYARLRADASNNNGGRVLLRAGTSGFVNVAGKTSITLSVTKNTYTSAGVLHRSGSFSSSVLCPSGTAILAGVESYSIFGVQGQTEPIGAPDLTLTAEPNPASCQTLFTSSTCRSTLNWSSSRATSCTASGDWSGSKSISGSEAVSFPKTDAPNTYSLNCSGPGGTVSRSVTVTAAP